MIERKIVKETDVLGKYRNIINTTETIRSLGTVRKVSGSVIYSHGPEVSLGELCHIEIDEAENYVLCRVSGFHDDMVILSPLESISGIFPGSRVVSAGHMPGLNINDGILGRVLDGMGRPLDNMSKITGGRYHELENSAPNPLHRPMISHRFETGVRAVDGFLTLGRGQRVGIFAGSGVGKSSLLGMMARYSDSDVNVIGLIGERGREVKEFIDNELGEHGMAKSVVVVASSNDTAMHRIQAAYMVTTIAEYFREQGKNVLLMMDSLTRLAMAQREVGLAAGEPASTKGYPPSVYSMMPDLLERAGNSAKGSITGIYTVLVEADDMNDPVADTARGILDGHIVLSRRLATRSHYPPIDVPESLSRSMSSVAEREHLEEAAYLKELLAAYRENEEIIQLGAYVKGSDQIVDQAIDRIRFINDFLRQSREEYTTFTQMREQMRRIARSRRTERQAALRRVS